MVWFDGGKGALLSEIKEGGTWKSRQIKNPCQGIGLSKADQFVWRLLVQK